MKSLPLILPLNCPATLLSSVLIKSILPTQTNARTSKHMHTHTHTYSSLFFSAQIVKHHTHCFLPCFFLCPKRLYLEDHFKSINKELCFYFFLTQYTPMYGSSINYSLSSLSPEAFREFPNFPSYQQPCSK